MQIYDIAIIGSGIGGTLFGALNHTKYDIILFEKDTNLGGCASTFKRFDGYYNSGATTFVGYEEGHIVKDMFDRVGYTPELIKTPLGLRIVQDGLKVDRVKNFDTFLEEIDRVYPNPNNRDFWHKIKSIDEAFWQLKHIYYAKHSIKSYLKTLRSVTELAFTFKHHLFVSATSFIQNILGDISPEYQAFIDAQLLITLQTSSKELSLLPMALGLAYPFHDTFYVKGGMGVLIDSLLRDVNVKTKEEIISIKPQDGLYRLKSNKGEYLAKNVVLNSSIYDSGGLFEDKKIQNYYKKFAFSDQSAFVVYLRLKSSKEFLHHYQIILQDNIPNSISNAFFVSFSDREDTKMSDKEGYSITISTHTKASIWRGLTKEEYNAQKEQTQSYIIEAFLDYFSTINKEDIIKTFSATANTFNRYISRSNCGGEALKLKNILNIPTCTTPFEGLYNVGDTIFAGQGWAGVALGVDILDKEFNG